jgi:small subunit ribosomal protein S4
MDLGHKTVGTKAHAQLLKRLNIPPGAHGQKRQRKQSDYGVQLREKQKVKHMYGTLERQFRNVFNRAKKWKGNTGDKLLEFLERRLDNTVYRMGLAPTRAAARQTITHGHVRVNDKKVDIPSYTVKADDVIRLTDTAMDIPALRKMIDDATYKPPEWLERKGPVGKVLRAPVRTDVVEDINEQLIVEFYSR